MALLPHLRALPLFVLEPTSVTDEAARRRARLLSATLFIIAVPIVTATRWHWLDARLIPFMYFGLLLLIVAYTFNRTGHYGSAAALTLGWLCAMPAIRLFAQQSRSVFGAHPMLPDAVFAVIIAYLLFSPRFVVFVFLWNTALLLIAPSISPVVFLSGQTLTALFMLFIVSALMMVASALRQYDVQQIARQSQALAESEARYRTLFESTFEAVIVHDGGVLLDANPAFAQMTGYSLWESVGKELKEFIAPGSHATLLEKLRLPPATPYELMLRRSDDQTLEIEVLDRPHVYLGRGVRVLAIRDITARNQAQAEHLELSIEREKRKMLLKLMSNVSHDLRTPLTVIKTGIYLLKRLMHDPVQRDKQIVVLEDQVDELKRLMDDLLNMSRLERSDTDEFHFTPGSVNDLLLSVIAEHRALSQRKGQTLVFRPHPALPAVLVDAEQLKRMFKHLLLNAVNYTPDGGTITVDTTVIDGSIVMRVRDTGVGIEPEDLPHIFDYFFRTDVARHSDQSGIGLGLTLARKIAEAHAGSIEVESSPGKGSTFTVRLPAAEVDVARSTRIR